MFSIETLEHILKRKLFSIERAEKYSRTIRKWQNSIIRGATKYADISIDMLDDYIDAARQDRENDRENNQHKQATST
jgi:hypothetical protein